MRIPGAHNALNAAGAFAVLTGLGHDPARVIAGLELFEGTGRRFEKHGDVHGVSVYDDYAHHPTEVEAALRTARSVVGTGRVIAIHQPHLYSRTRLMAGEFAATYEALADHTIVLDVFGAREDPEPGVTGALVAERFQDPSRVDYLPDWQQAADEVGPHRPPRRPGDDAQLRRRVPDHPAGAGCARACGGCPVKRPEGFDGSTATATAPTRPEKAQKAQNPQKSPKAPKAPKSQKSPRDPAPPGPPPRSRDAARSAQAELRAAERARKAHDRAELRRFTARTRRRRLAWLSAGVVVAVLVGLVAVAVYSPLLALRHIDVEGTWRLDSATVVKAVDGQLGVPLGLLDNGRLERELTAFTLIRSYTTELVPPDTMVIRINERQPIGTIQVGDTFELVDPAAIISSSTTQLATVPLISSARVRWAIPPSRAWPTFSSRSRRACWPR